MKKGGRVRVCPWGWGAVLLMEPWVVFGVIWRGSLVSDGSFGNTWSLGSSKAV